MDILIKGMGMPKGKEGKIIIYGLKGNYFAEYNEETHQAIWHEAVSIPEHGRLIDADALLPKSGYDPMMFKHKYDGDHRTQYDTLMGYEILGIVEDAPTIVEAST